MSGNLRDTTSSQKKMTREIGNSAPPSQYGGQKARNALKDAGAYNGDVRTEKKVTCVILKREKF